MEMTALEARLADAHLAIMGAFHPAPEDRVPGDARTLVLLGPWEPGFWDHVTAAPEFRDGAPDPLDRWSMRVIGRLAGDLGAVAHFPFGGPPYAPFFSWATASGAAWSSPVKLLVQARAGLMVSYRGALAFADRLPLPAAPESPCPACAQPCISACPVGALTPEDYDLDACHAYLDTEAGRDCLSRGCAVRRSCPVSQSYGRAEAQSAYHMGVFHK